MEENGGGGGGTPSPDGETPTSVPESPKPMAFTIDFNEGKSIDTHRHKSLVEKYQKRHRRGQSLSKLDDSPTSSTNSKKHPLSVNLPRKALGVGSRRDGLSLPLKNPNTDRMTQSCTLPCIESPEVEANNALDVSTPDVDLVSPWNTTGLSPERTAEEFRFIDGGEFDFDKAEVLSDAGTYTLDADNYSEEQKARMSIDRDFKIEQMSVYAKTREYVESLAGVVAEVESLNVATKMVEQWRIDSVEEEERMNRLSVETRSRKEVFARDVQNAQETQQVKYNKVEKPEPERLSSPAKYNEPVQYNETEKPVQYNKLEKLVQCNEIQKPVECNEVEKPVQYKDVEKPVQYKELERPVQYKEVEKSNEVEKLVKSEVVVTPELNIEKQIRVNYANAEKLTFMDDDALVKTQKVNFMRMKKRLDSRRPKSCTEEDLLKANNAEEVAHKPESLPFVSNNMQRCKNKLSPIVSPTQNISITETQSAEPVGKPEYAKTFQKIMFPSPKAKTGIGLERSGDKGSVISVTCSGAFRSKSERERLQLKKLSLSKSEVHVEAYTDNTCTTTEVSNKGRTNLSANLVLVSENLPKTANNSVKDSESVQTNVPVGKIVNLPPPVGGISGKVSPTTKIPSPVHTSRPRSRNSSNSLNIDLSDSSLETESYLKPTQNLLNSLQQRLSLDSDHECEEKYLNNDARNLLKKPTHMRHNSLDDRNLKISNKLEHFQNKNLIDQTYTNVLNQYSHGKIHKIQNSPNNSPIRRSSSFSTKNQINTKCSNIPMKDINLQNSPNFTRNGSIQRSSSTASIRQANANLLNRRPSITDHKNQFGDTESSSEDDLKVPNAKRKDITNTRYNRAFSLRRARLDEPPPPPPKCPNTPEMRRKFQPGDPRAERAISVDRRPVQSRYMLNATRGKTEPPQPPPPTTTTLRHRLETKGSPKIGNVATKPAPKQQVFSRTDSGRFSMRTAAATVKPAMTNSQKTIRKEISSGKKASGPRSNSSLTSKEVEFQNWKRRKSYDPMKAAAEGKKKAEQQAARQRQTHGTMTQSYHEANQDCDSSPSHSSSVHRSQSFHGTAALEQYISSEEEEDLTLSADEGFSPPTPSPCNLSPSRVQLRYAWKDQLLH